jgi:hypothetical protein
MDIVGKARRLERRIARSVDAAVGGFLGEPGGVSALEIVHAVVDAAEQQVQEAGRGRRLFPFNRVVVYIPAAARDKQARARFAAVAAGPPSLTSRLRERLEAAGCKADDLSADVVFVAKPQPEWRSPDYHVDFERGRAAAPPPPEPEPQPDEPPRLRLTVTAGSADRKVLLFDGGRVDIGRRAEVVDAQQRLVRTNHVAFTEDGEDVNRTVSRRHAHIIYNPTAHEYRLWDDRSAHGTAVVRGGRMIPVPSGARGTRLQSGDEIVVGQARLRVALEPASKK